MCDTCAIPLHQHSEFSQLDGYGRVTEIADRLVELGLPGGALTDHGVTCGWEPFADALLAKGLKPIFGIEAYQAAESRKLKPEGRKNDAAHLILLAKNETGRRNVRVLSDLAHRTGFHKAARLDWELLEQYREGVICTTACLGSLVSQGLKPIWEPEKTDLHEPDYSALSKLHRIFDEDLFVEIHTYSDPKQHLCNHALVEAARERGIPLVYATDGHFCSSDDWLMHEVILSMQMKRGLDQDKGDYGAWDDPKRWHPNDLYIADETDIRERLSYLDQSAVDEAVANSKLIFDQCDVKLPTPRLHLPVYTPTSEYEQSFDNNKQLLADLVEVGLIERYGSPLPEVVIERAMMELEQICGAFEDGRGLEDYFLIVKMICDFCDQKGIRRGIARGSAGGSIISYALRITKVDPIKYNLYFERFWNPGRKKELPDIDLDIQKSRRHEVVAMLKRVFGENRVLTIGTHTTVQPQAGIDGAGLALWGPRHGHYGDLDEIKTIIKLAIDAGQQPSWDAIWADEEIAEQLRPHREKYPEVFGIAEELYGRVSNYGTHASATIISDVDLPEHLPCRRAKGEGGEVTLVSQHEAGVTSKLGFPKFDLLGLRTLDVIDRCLEFAGNPDVDLDAIDSVVHEFPDEFWWNLENGKTLGLFQIEDGKAARSIAKRMSARTVGDVAAIVALNRPGPLRGGVVDRYFARRNDGEAVEYRHPILSDILGDTFGDWLYQESVLSYFRTIGYDLVEADKIREYLGKKKVAEMAAEKPRYLERASQFMPEQIAELIWADIEAFSKYSFNKCCDAKTHVWLPDGKKLHISAAYSQGIREVLSMWPDGKIRPHKIRKIVKTGRKEMLEVRTSKGHTFRGTPEHRLLSSRGYVPIGELKEGVDELIEVGSKASPILTGVTDKQREARRKNAVVASRSENGRRNASERMKARRASQPKAELDAMALRMREVCRERYGDDYWRPAIAAATERQKWLMANDPEWKSAFIANSLARVRDAYNTGPGWGICSIANDGETWCASRAERMMFDWLIERKIEFEPHKVLPNGRISDVYFGGIYWEMDGMDRSYSYFEEKYGPIPFEVVTPEDFKLKFEAFLLDEGRVANGDVVVSVTPYRAGQTYDIEMEPDGPLNFVAGRLVSHNSHSSAYGITLLQTMYLKWRWPAEFYAACIDVLNQSNVQNKMDKIGAFIREARTLGLDVRAPDVNVSDQRVSVKDGVIYLGLTEVKYVSEDAADYIMACRPLTSHEDFVESLEAESKAWKKEDKGTRNPKSPKQLCTSRAVSTLLSVGAFDSIGGREGMVSRDRAALEVDGMGIALTDPDADVLAEYDELPDAPSLDVVSDVDRDEVEVIGFVEKTTRFKVRKGRFAGREMGHLVLRWSGDTARVTLFSGEWERFKFALSDDAFIKCVVRPNVKGPTVKHISLM